ncbi:type II toxin-antitoxin system VapC family toxin [[Limnothrix rosea] IAM M-220]|uniref:type II toxin-antitoxin system VapC family toxin n=1 Tax=[Limnothrix rosea] IAM M-220 TaxID=454133 RepID=UPI0009663E13|nr:type II toxin-antitoxin system VapC family toxin [[Limnothrix rosea] IAM M-220]OKH17622.1 twitching motility protein PilT [[Limnothrix rosea] IAM M-220]
MYLLDTHILLWYLAADQQLNPEIRAILDQRNNLHLSVASLWEIAIKFNIGKLPNSSSYDEILEQVDFLNINQLNLSRDDLVRYKNLPLNKKHRDPFDRILIAQAIQHSLTLVTADSKFRTYDLEGFRLYLD